MNVGTSVVFPPLPDLPREVLALLAQIPAGRVSTYGDLAAALGSASAARWVGEFLMHHDHDEACPCHRVVRVTGEPGLYIAGTPFAKQRRLQVEGIVFRNGRVDLARQRFDSFTTGRPLEALVALQKRVPQLVSFEPLAAPPRLVAGVDVSYAAGRAIAAGVLVEIDTGRVLWGLTVESHAVFPYIPGLLTFREVPVLLELLPLIAEQPRQPEAFIVDGNGLLHPRRAGSATQFGLAAGRPTIGIGKKLLCGSVDLKAIAPGDSRPVIADGRELGRAIVAANGSRPIFVSPGHRIDVADAVAVVERSFHGHRLPEPVYRADALSRRIARERRG